MKSFKSAAIYSSFILAAAVFAGTAVAADGTASANADVVNSIGIAKVSGGDLDFGDVIASGTAGTVTVSTAGVRSAADGTSLGNADGARQASFNISGDANATYSITLPTSATITHATAVTKTMTVNGFTSNPATTGTLSSSGTQVLNVGATLNVGISQTAGAYTGSFTVTVAYN